MTNAMAIVNIEILAGLWYESPQYIAGNPKRSEQRAESYLRNASLRSRTYR